MPHSPAEAFEDVTKLQIGLVEASIPNGQTSWSGYPFPQLTPLHESELRTFRTIILENSLIRATLLPDLGGRVIGIHDKRTGAEILPLGSPIMPQSGGSRGAFLRQGVEICLDSTDRLNSMGPVSAQIEHSADEDSDAAVWIAETCGGTGLSFHVRISVPPDRAEVRFETRVLNRRFRPEPYNGGLMAHVGTGGLSGTAFYSADRDAGILVSSEGQLFDGVEYQDGCLKVVRFDRGRSLAPRQVDTWRAILTPFSGLGGLVAASPHAGVALSNDSLRLQSTQQRLGHKLLMLTSDGETLEAVVDLYPETTLDISLGGRNPTELVLLDPGKQEVFRHGLNAGAQIGRQRHTGRAKAQETNEGITPSSTSDDLQRASFDVATRHRAYTLLGMQALGAKKFASAATYFEQALNFNADDPLLWWARSVALRLEGLDNEQELLNAHYLAPMEPALRAESFLSLPVDPNPEPNVLLSSLDERPEEFIEVACLLIECGLFDQASRWIDEALRHCDLPMLRYLMAYCLITGTSLYAEAAEQLRLAGAKPIAPPFPYRDMESQAIQSLLKAFLSDRNLGAVAALLASNR